MGRLCVTVTRGTRNAIALAGKPVAGIQWWTERFLWYIFATFSILFHVSVCYQNSDPLLIFKFSNSPLKR